MHKKGHKLKTSPLIKNSQFSSNLADIQTKLLAHEVVILTKFHKDCKKIIDFLLKQKFLVCALFYASPSISSKTVGAIEPYAFTQTTSLSLQMTVRTHMRTILIRLMTNRYGKDSLYFHLCTIQYCVRIMYTLP